MTIKITLAIIGAAAAAVIVIFFAFVYGWTEILFGLSNEDEEEHTDE